VPLWIIDGEVTSIRFLLAVHCTPASLLAADHLAFMMQGNPEAEILLYHSSAAFGSTRPSPAEEFHRQWGKEWCAEHLDLDDHLYRAHTQVLKENGIAEKRIIRIEPHRDIDASHDLVRQARKHSCGSVVIGRRGREVDKGLLGGVSDRATQMAENMAVWLVG
jgi:nucleotide-binding universal stress UspA family protein